MRNYSRNLTYYGFLRFYDAGGVESYNGIGVSCSQIVRTFVGGESKTKDSKRLEFYIPNDWLDYQFKNEYFMKWWVELAEQWFYVVKWEGKFKGEEIALDAVKINQNMGYTGKLDKMFLRQRGDYIVNNIWHKFSMKIDSKIPGYNFKMYCAYCMIRYLFASHYQSIVKDLMDALRRGDVCSFDNNGGLTFIKGVDLFRLFQLMHYGLSNYEDGYHGTFSLMATGNINDKCVKLKSLKEVEDYFGREPMTGKSVHGAFLGSQLQVTRKEIQHFFKSGQYKGAYDKIL